MDEQCIMTPKPKALDGCSSLGWAYCSSRTTGCTACLQLMRSLLPPGHEGLRPRDWDEFSNRRQSGSLAWNYGSDTSQLPQAGSL